MILPLVLLLPMCMDTIYFYLRNVFSVDVFYARFAVDFFPFVGVILVDFFKTEWTPSPSRKRDVINEWRLKE